MAKDKAKSNPLQRRLKDLRAACDGVPESSRRSVEGLLQHLTAYLEDVSKVPGHAPMSLSHVLLSLQSLLDLSLHKQKKPLAAETNMEVVSAVKDRLDKIKTSAPREIYVDVNPVTEVVSMFFGGQKNKMRFYTLVSAVKAMTKSLNAVDEGEQQRWELRVHRMAGSDGLKKLQAARDIVTKLRGKDHD